jgi:hypothetical protein
MGVALHVIGEWLAICASRGDDEGRPRDTVYLAAALDGTGI